MSDSKQALEAWKRADAEARAVESRLLAGWELYEKRLVAPPAEDLLRQVALLRAAANEKLSLAMIALAAANAQQRSASGRETSSL